MRPEIGNGWSQRGSQQDEEPGGNDRKASGGRGKVDATIALVRGSCGGGGLGGSHGGHGGCISIALGNNGGCTSNEVRLEIGNGVDPTRISACNTRNFG